MRRDRRAKAAARVPKDPMGNQDPAAGQRCVEVDVGEQHVGRVEARGAAEIAGQQQVAAAAGGVGGTISPRMGTPAAPLYGTFGSRRGSAWPARIRQRIGGAKLGDALGVLLGQVRPAEAAHRNLVACARC